MARRTFNWERFSASVDAPIPYPSTPAILLEPWLRLGESIMRQATIMMVVDGWKLANSSPRIGSLRRPGTPRLRSESSIPRAFGFWIDDGRPPRLRLRLFPDRADSAASQHG